MSMPYRVLVVEDEAGIRLGLEDSLRVAGYAVETVEDGEAALGRAASGNFDVIVLDLILPDRDGLSVCVELRNRGIRTPILMLTAKTRLEDMLRGFSVGADDYLTKPFEVMELLARMRAVLNRSQTASGQRSQYHVIGSLRFDARTGVVWRASSQVGLSAKESRLLLYFLAHPAETLTRERLLRDVWESKLEASTRTIDLHVASLRKKIGDAPANPRWICTAYGAGYEFLSD
jgi:DNA-binding response OmpR family regulator